MVSYLQKKANAIDELVALDMKINGSDMSDAFWKSWIFVLQTSFFFKLIQDKNGYYKLVSDIKVFVNRPPLRYNMEGKRRKLVVQLLLERMMKNYRTK